jgi:hypothetical protein
MSSTQATGSPSTANPPRSTSISASQMLMGNSHQFGVVGLERRTNFGT